MPTSRSVSSRARRTTGAGRRIGTIATGTIAFVILLVLLGGCALMGGSYRGDLPQLILLRSMAAIAIGAWVTLGANPREPATLRALWMLLAALAAWAALQLVPLPPALWSRLPGHAPFLQAAIAAGIPQPWRPISVAPDMTWNTIACLLVPAGVLLGYAASGGERQPRLLPWLIGLGGVSALIGLTQIVGGRNGGFYLYPGTTDPLPVGLLANRNHQALLLASMLPLLAAWTWPADRAGRTGPHRYVVAGIAALLLMPVILATGSRSGLALALIGGVAGVALLPWHRVDRRHRQRALFGGIAGVVLLAAVAAATAVAGRATVFDRLAGGDDLSSEMRVASAPTIVAATRAFLPFGTGFGTFDPAFRTMEPDALLTPTYRNHAHNDLLELAMTGGLIGIGIALAFLAWLARATMRIWRLPRDARRALGLAAVTGVVLALLASLTDYPLRTPLMQAWFVLCCGWIATAAQWPVPTTGEGRRSRGAPRGEPRSGGGRVAFSSVRG